MTLSSATATSTPFVEEQNSTKAIAVYVHIVNREKRKEVKVKKSTYIYIYLHYEEEKETHNNLVIFDEVGPYRDGEDFTKESILRKRRGRNIYCIELYSKRLIWFLCTFFSTFK